MGESVEIDGIRFSKSKDAKTGTVIFVLHHPLFDSPEEDAKVSVKVIPMEEVKNTNQKH